MVTGKPVLLYGACRSPAPNPPARGPLLWGSPARVTHKLYSIVGASNSNENLFLRSWFLYSKIGTMVETMEENLRKFNIIIVSVFSSLFILFTLFLALYSLETTGYVKTGLFSEKNRARVRELRNLVDRPELVIDDQRLPSIVIIRSVKLTDPGFIVIQKDEDGEPAELIGATGLLAAREIKNLQITLDMNMRKGEFYFATLYVDRDNDGRLTISNVGGGGFDSPFLVDANTPVRVRFKSIN